MKLWKMMVGGMFVLSAIIGLIGSRSYTNLLKDENNINKFSVAPMKEGMMDLPEEEYLEVLNKSPIVLRVMTEGSRKYINGGIRQPVKVLQVYKGNNDIIADKIELLTTRTFFDFRQMTFNTGFVNLMKQGMEYLVFCDEKIASPFEGDAKLYRVSDMVINPIFSYIDVKNVISKNTDRYVSYPYFSTSEFFAQDENTLNKFMNLKRTLFLQYPR